VSENNTDADGGIPLNSVGQIVGIFALVGVGIGLTGGVAMSQLGSGGAIIGGILTLVILTIAFLLGPVISIITGLRTGEQQGRTGESYLAGLLGSVVGYFVMMAIVLLILSVVMAIVMGDGGSSSTAAQSTTSTASSSESGLPIGEYIIPIIAVAIPTGLTGLGGVFFGGSERSATAGGAIDVPWKYAGIGVAVILLITAGVVYVPGALTAGPQQLEVTGDASTTQTELFAEGTVENPANNEISTTLTIEFVIDGAVVTTTDEDITVPANDEIRLSVRVATVDDMTTQQILAVSNGEYQLRYIIEGETVDTYEP
jgi:hypothetical protein